MDFLLKAHELQEGHVDKYSASEEPTEEELRAMDVGIFPFVWALKKQKKNY